MDGESVLTGMKSEIVKPDRGWYFLI
jgi:hypothetical protein